MKIGLAGPRLGGKSTLFAAITGHAPDPTRASGQGPVPGVVPVEDPRLDYLTSVFKPRKHTPAQLEVLDFPGLDLGETSEHKKRIMAQLREVDALILVFAAYAEGQTLEQAAESYDTVKTEFLFADLEMMDKRIEKLRVSVTKASKTQEQDQRELVLLERLKKEAEAKESLAGAEMDATEQKLVRSFAFLIQKPLLVVLNVADPPKGALPDAVKKRCPDAIRLSAKLEQEIGELAPEERGAFLKEMELEEAAARKLVREVYRLLGLCSFFTVGEDECRAWTIPVGENVVIAAGKIHSDLARGFIRADVYSFDDFQAHGSEKVLRAKGLIRSEGRDYTVQDGDIVHIHFNVSKR